MSTHTPETSQGTVTTYIVGFVLSLLLTILAYGLVTRSTFSKGLLFTVVIALALTQLLVQLIFFLHMDKESRPRWNLVVFSFMLLVVFIVVFGSLWIMYNLSYHHAHNIQTPQQIIKDEGIKP